MRAEAEVGWVDWQLCPRDDLTRMRPGSVIELDRMVGEPADLLANGHLIAHGEVVVVDGAFALRITDIVEPDDRAV